MTFLQLVLREPDHWISGSELRNKANLTALSIFEDAKSAQYPLEDTLKTKEVKISPTIINISLKSINDMLSLIKESRPSFILVEGVVLLQALIAVRKRFPALPVILDMHNFESALLIENDRAKLPWMLRPLSGLIHTQRHQAALSADRLAVSLASAVWTCSEREAQLVRSHLDATLVTTVPNPVPDWCAGADATPLSDHGDVLFLGHLGYAPNKRAVAELCRRVMPKLQQRLPAATLHVCGRGPGRSLSKLVAACGHRLTANPPDLAPIYAQASVAAMPLREGGGTRLKVLEALAAGCPIVATAKAVEGLNLVPDLHYLRAETAHDFAARLAEVLTSGALRNRLADAGRALIAERFGAKARIGIITASVTALLTAV